MRRKSDVSVIIPAYNEEKHIRKCIESLLNQTLKAREIIVVDDGSTDETYQICTSYGEPVKVFRKNHSGAGSSRNFGALKARGEILVFFDADMVAPPDYLEKLVTPILRGEAIGTDHGDELVLNHQNMWSRCWCIEWRVPVGRRVPEPRKGLSDVFRAIRKDLFLQIGGFDEKLGYCDDNLGRKNLKAVFVENAVCYHHNPDNLKDVFLSSAWVGRGIIPTLPKTSTSRKIKKIISRFIKHSIMSPINGLRFAIKHREPFFLIFKIIYDMGILYGMITYILSGRVSK